METTGILGGSGVVIMRAYKLGSYDHDTDSRKISPLLL